LPKPFRHLAKRGIAKRANTFTQKKKAVLTCKKQAR
jgi:hypothetical protein